MRIGIVPYLNALPLCRYLKRPVTFGTPVELTRQMENGELDIALLPSFAFLSSKSYLPLYEAGVIQSFGTVASVTLFLKEGIDNLSRISKINYSEESVTSNILFKVINKYWTGGDPSSLKEVRESADARLIIGDRALFHENGKGKKIDLGELWTDWTSLPFIYALWVARVPVPKEVVNDLVAAKNEGLSKIDEIVNSVRDLPLPKLKSYLTQNIRYEMRPNSLRGLGAFQDYAVKMGLLAHARPL